MQAINATIISIGKENIKTQLTNIAQGGARSGKEVVREGMMKLQNMSDERHKKLMNKFLSEEGKGVTISVEI
jgi:peptide subunit release factor 1 (eRF1)